MSSFISFFLVGPFNLFLFACLQNPILNVFLKTFSESFKPAISGIYTLNHFVSCNRNPFLFSILQLTISIHRCQLLAIKTTPAYHDVKLCYLRTDLICYKVICGNHTRCSWTTPKLREYLLSVILVQG